jgi:hypothetical protein
VKESETFAMNVQAVQGNQNDLFQAAVKRFGSWNDALRAAGIEPEAVRLRS